MSSLPLEDSSRYRSNKIEINWPINDSSNTPLTPTDSGLELRRQQFEEHGGIIVFLDALGVTTSQISRRGIIMV